MAVVSRLPKWVEYGAFILALVAGFVNAVGLLGFQHQSISHLSGYYPPSSAQALPAPACYTAPLTSHSLLSRLYSVQQFPASFCAQRRLENGPQLQRSSCLSKAFMLLIAIGLLNYDSSLRALLCFCGVWLTKRHGHHLQRCRNSNHTRYRHFHRHWTHDRAQSYAANLSTAAKRYCLHSSWRDSLQAVLSVPSCSTTSPLMPCMCQQPSVVCWHCRTGGIGRGIVG